MLVIRLRQNYGSLPPVHILPSGAYKELHSAWCGAKIFIFKENTLVGETSLKRSYVGNVVLYRL